MIRCNVTVFTPVVLHPDPLLLGLVVLEVEFQEEFRVLGWDELQEEGGE